MLRAVARVDLGAIERNCARLVGELTGGAALCAVIKADAYGHGAIPVARAALRGGAGGLAVATAQEAADLRASGLADARLLVMGALTRDELDLALGADADVVAWSEDLLQWIGDRPARVHVKLDTGMGRLGTRDPSLATKLCDALRAADGPQLVATMTHFATADDRDDPFFSEQLGRYEAWAPRDVPRHAANSAATLRDPRTHLDMVRCGVAIYGMDPFGDDPGAHELHPALELCSFVAAVKDCAAGESAGYGRRFVAAHDTVLATIPVGYGDGWRRGLTNNAEVVIVGERRPLVGTVSMDNITVDLGAGSTARVGDEVVLLGAGITAEEVARRLDTINYEVTCAITARVPRDYFVGEQ